MACAFCPYRNEYDEYARHDVQMQSVPLAFQVTHLLRCSPSKWSHLSILVRAARAEQVNLMQY